MQFEEEPIPNFELAPGERSSPQQFDDISEDSCSVFSDIPDNDMVVDDIFVYESPSRPKWAEKIIQVARELAGNPQDPRRLDLKLVMLPFQVKILLLRTVIC